MIAWLILIIGMSPVCGDAGARLANHRGIERAQAQDFQGAASEFRKALQLDPACPVIQVNLAIACLNSGELEESQAQLNRLGTVAPDDPYVIYLSGVLLVRRGRETEAREPFQRLLDLDPSDSATMSQLGLIEFHEGNHARAAQLFRNAIEIDPDNTVALYNLARLSIMEGKRAEGDRLIERFRNVKQRPIDRPVGGMGEPVVVPGKYARLRSLGEVEPGS